MSIIEIIFEYMKQNGLKCVSSFDQRILTDDSFYMLNKDALGNRDIIASGSGRICLTEHPLGSVVLSIRNTKDGILHLDGNRYTQIPISYASPDALDMVLDEIRKHRQIDVGPEIPA